MTTDFAPCLLINRTISSLASGSKRISCISLDHLSETLQRLPLRSGDPDSNFTCLSIVGAIVGDRRDRITLEASLGLLSVCLGTKFS